MATILIAGCGYIGSALTSQLLAQGHTVFAIRRHSNLLPTQVVALSLDLTSLKASDLPAEIDYVFYLASADGYTEHAYQQAYQLGLANLLNQLQLAKQQPKRILFSSSTAVYGQMQSEWVDETSETIPLGFGGKIMLAAEQILQSAPFPTIILRFSGIYGPERDRLVKSVIAGTARLSSQPVYTNRIHRTDCVGALLHLMQIPDPLPVYLASDHQPVTKNELLTWLAQQLDKSLLPADNLASAQEQDMRGNKRCSNKRLIDSGYSFHYPSFREGYGELLFQPS